MGREGGVKQKNSGMQKEKMGKTPKGNQDE